MLRCDGSWVRIRDLHLYNFTNLILNIRHETSNLHETHVFLKFTQAHLWLNCVRSIRRYHVIRPSIQVCIPTQKLIGRCDYLKIFSYRIMDDMKIVKWIMIEPLLAWETRRKQIRVYDQCTRSICWCWFSYHDRKLCERYNSKTIYTIAEM